MEEEILYTVKEFATLIKMSPQTVRDLIKKEKIKAIKFGDKKRSEYRIPKTEIPRVLALAYKEEE